MQFIDYKLELFWVALFKSSSQNVFPVLFLCHVTPLSREDYKMFVGSSRCSIM
jgi:hypothetical protein